VIQVVIGVLVECKQEGILCPIRADLAPMTVGARDVLDRAGSDVSARLGGLGQLPVGGAFLTPGGESGAAFLIHVVTASEEEPETPLSVQRALRNGLRRAAEWSLKSLALPPLGMGVGHLEPEDDARTVLELLFNHLDEGQPPLDLTVVVANEYEREMFERLVDAMSRDRFPMRN
jgi:O-acetyl-ADP-ribose deacetylase (regulator of RNase III)